MIFSFKKYLNEQALNHDQQFYIDHYVNWDNPQKRDVNFSDHLFDKDRPPSGGVYQTRGHVVNPDTVVFDIPKPQLRPEGFIEDHLKDLGYHIHDYAAGLARREGSKRPISIGKILSKKEDPPDKPFSVHDDDWSKYRMRDFRRQSILSDYNKSDVRAAMKTPMQIMITRDPYKVASMSTGTPRWKSCMFLGTCPTRDLLDDGGWHEEEEKVPYHQRSGYQRPGQYARNMEHELLSGTHVAYLIGAGDHELKNPFARIALKPYHSEDVDDNYRKLPEMSKRYGHTWSQIKPEHTILRPSSNTYTSTNIYRHGSNLIDHFRDVVNDLTKAHFPMKHDEYHLDPMSYRDSGDPKVWSDNPRK